MSSCHIIVLSRVLDRDNTQTSWTAARVLKRTFFRRVPSAHLHQSMRDTSMADTLYQFAELGITWSGIRVHSLAKERSEW